VMVMKSQKGGTRETKIVDYIWSSIGFHSKGLHEEVGEMRERRSEKRRNGRRRRRLRNTRRWWWWGARCYGSSVTAMPLPSTQHSYAKEREREKKTCLYDIHRNDVTGC
jgi:hypothetical protein